jgi:hypothetical protein
MDSFVQRAGIAALSKEGDEAVARMDTGVAPGVDFGQAGKRG